ncbi:putative ribonuclease H-like domain-containing protein [Tanacetum coccineum]
MTGFRTDYCSELKSDASISLTMKKCNIKFLIALPPSWTFEIDVKGGSSYDSRGTSAPTHSAFIMTANMWKLWLASIYGMIAGAEEDAADSATGDVAGDVADGVSNAAAEFALMGISSQVQTCPFGCEHLYAELKKEFDNVEVQYKECYIQVQAYKSILQTLEQHKGWYQSNQLALEEKVRILTANLENTTNMLKYTEKLNEQAKLEKLDYMAKLEESKARFDKWKDSSKNLDKLIHSSMSSRSKFGLGFGETFGSDEVFDLSAPSIFDTTPEDVAEKPLYDMFVKAVGMHVVPPPITGTFMPPSNNPDIDDTQFTYGSKSNNYVDTNSVSNDFVSCDNSDKSSDSETTDFASCVSSVKSSSSKTNEPLASTPSSVDFKTMTETADQQPSSTNDDSSFSFKENVKPPRHLCNKSGINSRSFCKRKSFGSKTCFVCGSKFHLIKDCDFYEKQLELNNKPMWTNVANIPSFVPKAASNSAGSRNRQTSVPAGSRNRPPSVQLENPHKNRDLRIVDSGCSRSMTGNKEKLDDFVKIVGGTVTLVENKVLFTDKECLVLSKEFQLPELSQVVVRIPRRHNLYCFNLSNIQPERDVTCLLAKASLEESTKWHRRMAHVNFKNMNKLAKHGLVNGLPSKLFTNEHNCVACNKGKQHKASYKAITAVSTISAPLQLLHMDLFGPTSIRSIDHKYYFLVVTDDFSRFTWVFFLGTKDETYGIFKDFITFIENQLTKKVKAIRCDNGTEFKNSKLIELCGSKGIRRDYILPEPQQQNGVVERKNRTLIERARTMHADSMLAYMFWTKQYTAFMSEPKKIEETLNLRYLEDKPNVQGLGHEWYFDLDYLTDSLGYTRFKTTHPAGAQDTNIHAGTQDDSDSECDEQVIVVPSFPSNSFSGTKVNEASEMMESSSDYAEELARLQKQAYEANSIAEQHLSQADLATSRNGVPAGKVVPAADVSAGHSQTSTPVCTPVHTAAPSFPPGHSLGSSAHSTRYPSPSDLANSMSSFSEMEDIYHHPDIGIFSSSSYDDEFWWVNTIHPQSQILGDLTSPVQTRAKCKRRCNSLLIRKYGSLYPLPKGKFAIGTKWILKNKRDARGIVVRNKARLVAQGHRQKEGIDYNEVLLVKACRSSSSTKGLLPCPDIQFASSASSRPQVPPLTSQLEVQFFMIKKILQNCGCPQFLGRRLISRQSQKQTIVATSSTEANIVAALALCVVLHEESDIILMIHIHSGWLSVCLLVKEFLLVALNVPTGRTVPAGFVSLISS